MTQPKQRYESWPPHLVLAHLAHAETVRQELARRGLSDTADVVLHVTGGLRQSEAYWSTARAAPLEVRPVLAYYATYSLLTGFLALVTGIVPDIRRHGMSADLLPTDDIANLSVTPWTGEEAKVGALQQIAKEFLFRPSSQGLHGGWTLRELLGSIAELDPEYVACFPGARTFVAPVDVVANERGITDVISAAVLSRFESTEELLSGIQDYETFYLTPQSTPTGTLALRRKSGVAETSWRTPDGRKFLLLRHNKPAGAITPHPLVVMLMGLFGMAHLARYVPARWSLLVGADESGQRFLLERFLVVCEAMIPTLIVRTLVAKLSDQ